MSNITIDLLTNDKLASDVIVKYASWFNYNVPFTTVYDDILWARTQDVLMLIDSSKTQSFIQQRSNRKVFYVELGSKRFVDNSERYEVVNDPRLLITWLHNPCSVALALMTTTPTFNAYIGGNLDGIPPRYKYPQLMQLWEDYQDKLAVDDFLAA